MSEALRRVQAHLDHAFSDPSLLEQALTHSSYANEQGVPSNERLEFLGDAILKAGISILLWEALRDAPEGELSRARAPLVANELLAGIAARLELGPGLRLGRGEESSGGRHKIKVLADATEAVLGALYLDAGFERALQAVRALLAEPLAALEGEGVTAWTDPIGKLQEVTQRRWQVLPDKASRRVGGTDHEPIWEFSLHVGERFLARATAASIPRAEKLASIQALLALEAEEAP